MDIKILLLVSCVAMAASAWSFGLSPVRSPPRLARFLHPPPPPAQPQMRSPIRVQEYDEDPSLEEDSPRQKRNHEDFEHRDSHGVAGPVHTFVKTDKNANYKWGVRHHVGNKYASEH